MASKPIILKWWEYIKRFSNFFPFSSKQTCLFFLLCQSKDNSFALFTFWQWKRTSSKCGFWCNLRLHQFHCGLSRFSSAMREPKQYSRGTPINWGTLQEFLSRAQRSRKTFSCTTSSWVFRTSYLNFFIVHGKCNTVLYAYAAYHVPWHMTAIQHMIFELNCK